MKTFIASLNSVKKQVATATAPTISVSDVVVIVPPDPQVINLSFNPAKEQTSIISTTYNGDSIEVGVIWNDAGNVYLNHDSWKINGLSFVTGDHDNMPPFYFNDKTIGGVHNGYLGINLNISHNKTDDDYYSLWQLDGGTEQIVLVGINLIANQLKFVPRIGNTVTPGLYNHVSGALNTSSINVVGFTEGSVPVETAYNIISRTCKVDGVEIDTSVVGSYTASENIIFEQYIGFPDPNSLAEYYLSNQGIGHILTNGGGNNDVVIRYKWIIDETGLITGINSFEVFKDNLPFSRIMFMQQVEDISAGDYWYMPRSKTNTDIGKDFNVPVPWFDVNGEGYDVVGFTKDPTRFIDAFPDRQFTISTSTGLSYVQGLLPVRGGGFDARNQLVTSAFNISPKMYFNSVLQNAVGSFLPAGTKFEVVAYRGCFKNVAGQTALYFIKDYETGKGYMYGDWHDLPTNKTIAIPNQYQGKSFTIVEKTDNVAVTEGILNSTLNVFISDSLPYSWLTIEISE